MSEEKKPYLIINEEYDEIKINIKHTKPYMKLQQENKQLKEKIEQQTKICLADHKYASSKEDEVIVLTHERDLYKEVIEEVRDYIFNHELVEEKDNYVLNGKELLQILDKVKENK